MQQIYIYIYNIHVQEIWYTSSTVIKCIRKPPAVSTLSILAKSFKVLMAFGILQKVYIGQSESGGTFYTNNKKKQLIQFRCDFTFAIMYQVTSKHIFSLKL